jgi:mannose-6-phosphate isomerase-like protein (cupin superfamily)
MPEPVIISQKSDNEENHIANSAVGSSFIIHKWRGSGPDYLHVHYEDDEAWHVLEGILTFRINDRVIEASQGTTVFVPAGTPHTYSANASACYLVILTVRLNELISELHKSPYNEHAAIMKKYKSEILS